MFLLSVTESTAGSGGKRLLKSVKECASLYKKSFKDIERAGVLNLLFFIPCAIAAAVLLLIMGAQSGLYSAAFFAFLCFFPMCISSTGTAFITRNIVNGKSYSIKTDFFRMLRENWKQSLLVGIIDEAALFLTIQYVPKLWQLAQENEILYVPTTLLAVLGLAVLMANHYVYTLMVTFSLGNVRLLGNAAIVAIGNLPVSLGMTVLELLLSGVCFVGYFLTEVGTALNAVALILGLLLYGTLVLPMITFIRAFIVWPIFEKVIENTKRREEEEERKASEQAEQLSSEDEAQSDESDEDDSAEEQLPEREPIPNGDEMVFYQGRLVRRDEIEFL